MSVAFDLLDEPWLPVRLLNGDTRRLGLIEAFERSCEIVALAETAPPNLVAQYRLLLAIFNRALVASVGRWRTKDRARWFEEGLPQAEIRAYLETWRARFSLFDPSYPFMQVPALALAEETRDKRKPWTQIDLASANGNTPLLFDHSCDVAPCDISPADAVATLLGFLQFTPGGLVKTLRDADKAGALVNTAAVLPTGRSLAETLCLALHPAPPASAPPDLPSWEREPPSIAELRGPPILASGPNDRYTRNSRAVLLCREDDGNVRWLRFAAGLALGDDPQARDPMASYREGSNGPVRITFFEGRALWRDLPALIPNTGTQSAPAAVVNYAASLRDELDLSDGEHQPLLVAGIASDQAKLLRWRMEQFSLPASLLLVRDQALHLRDCVGQADVLFGEVKRLATSMLAETLPDPGSKDTRSRARAVIESGPLATTYFAGAERALPTLLESIGAGDLTEAQSRWQHALHASALQAWQQVLAGLGGSAGALRADARYWPRFVALLRRQLPDARPFNADHKETA